MKRALKRLAIGVGAFVALVLVGSFGTWALWNGTALARTVSGWVSSSLAGAGGPHQQAFTIGKIRYGWLPALRSFLLGGSAPFEAWDIGIWDPEGHEVVYAPHVTGRIHVGWVAWAQILSALPGRGIDTEVHLEDLHLEGGRARIAPIGASPAVPAQAGKVNIVAAFASRTPSPSDPRSRLVITANRAVLDDIEYTMEFPGWRAEVNRAHVELDTLRYSSWLPEQLPDSPAFTFRVGPVTAPTARLLLGGSWDFPMRDFSASRFASRDPDRDNLAFSADATARGAPAHIEGQLTGAYSEHPGVDATLRFTGGAGLAAMLPGKGLIAGDPRGTVRFHGPFSHVVIDGDGADAEFHLAGLAARALSSRFVLDRGVLSLSGVQADLGGGRVRGTVDLDFNRLDWRARLAASAVDPSTLTPLVPEGETWREVLGGSLDGTATASGSFVTNPDQVAVTDIAATLRRRAPGPLPRDIDLRGALGISPERVRFEGFRLEGMGLAAVLRGHATPARRTIRSEVVLSGRNLTALLRRFGVSDLASGLSGRTMVSGDLLEPTIDGEVSATQVGVGDHRLPRVDAHVHFEHGTLAATHVRSRGFGDGTIAGQLTVGLWKGPFTRRLVDPTLDGRFTADRLEVEELLGLPALNGQLRGSFEVGGTASSPTGRTEFELPALRIFGDPYHGGIFRADVRREGLEVREISLVRDQGGRFSGRGKVKWNGDLDVDVEPRSFPLQAIPPLRDAPVTLGGMLSGAVHLGGALGKWIPAGVIEADGLRVRDFALGDGRIDLRPEGNLVSIAGAFLRLATDPERSEHFRIGVKGWLTLTPTVAGDVTLTFERLPLDEMIPEMKQLAEVQAFATGTAHVHFDLPRRSASIDLRLSRLQIQLAGDEEGEGVAEEFKNPPGEDIVVEWDGQDVSFRSFHLVDERVSPARAPADGGAPTPETRQHVGDLEIAGRLSPDRSDATVRGRLDLHLLELLAARLFEHTHGEAVADLRVLGRMTRPQLRGTLRFDNAELQPRGAEKEHAFRVSRGLLTFDEQGARLDDLHVRSEEGAQAPEAVIAGRVQLDPAWNAGEVAGTLRGEVAASLFEWLLPDHVGEAQGRFGVDVALQGSYRQPRWSGFVEAREVAFREKRLSRDVKIRSGTAAIRQMEIVVGCPDLPAVRTPAQCRRIVARVDDSSDLTADGQVVLKGSVLAPRIDRLILDVTGHNLEWTSPGVFSLTLSTDEVNGRGLRLRGDDEQLRLEGRVTLVTGRYYQDFDMKNFIIRPRTEEREPPFYDGIPLLENMELDISTASSGAMFIKDNIADLQVTIPSLQITGTLAEPKLGGTVQVQPGGRFTIPLLRGDFVSESGTILFESSKEFPRETPRLDIKAASDWQDRYDALHRINLSIRGTYEAPELDFSSTDGWDKNQVLIAMVTGGTPDQIRRAVTEPTRTPGGTTMSDGIPKSLSNLLLRNIEDPLRQGLGVDLVRLELGYDSVLIKLCLINKITYRICGTGDVGFVSSTRYDARLELKLTDYVTMGAVWERVEHGVETTEDVITRGKLQLSLRYPVF